MKRNTDLSVPAVGASSLLVIFAVLCIVIFAALCLATAQTGKQLSEKGALAAEEFYAADCRGEEILARLRMGEMPQGVSVQGDIYRYECEIDEESKLCVVLRRSGEDFSVLSWQCVSTAQWEREDSLPVWTGREGD